MKLGIIGEEMVATAVKLASEHGARLEATYVIRVPMELPLDGPMPEEEARASASLDEAVTLGEENGVDVQRAPSARVRSAARSSTARASSTPT